MVTVEYWRISTSNEVDKDAVEQCRWWLFMKKHPPPTVSANFAIEWS